STGCSGRRVVCERLRIAAATAASTEENIERPKIHWCLFVLISGYSFTRGACAPPIIKPSLDYFFGVGVDLAAADTGAAAAAAAPPLDVPIILTASTNTLGLFASIA